MTNLGRTLSVLYARFYVLFVLRYIEFFCDVNEFVGSVSYP